MRGGETITQIQQRTGAHVQVQRDHDPSHPDLREVTIQGTPEQIAQAKQQVQAQCDGARSQMPPNRMMGGPGGNNMMGGPGGNMGGPGGNNMIGDFNDSISVPNNVVGIIIGRGGETIKRLQADTGCGIQVQPENMMPPGAQERKIMLKGNDEQLANAKREISMLADQHKDTPYIHAGIGHQHETVAVPAGCIGLLIGKSGDTVKMIANNTRTRIQVQKDEDGKMFNPNDSNEDSSFRNVSIRGDEASITAAKVEIQKIIDEHAQRHGVTAHQLSQPMHQYFGMDPQTYKGYIQQMQLYYGMSEQQVIDYYKQAMQQYAAMGMDTQAMMQQAVSGAMSQMNAGAQMQGQMAGAQMSQPGTSQLAMGTMQTAQQPVQQQAAAMQQQQQWQQQQMMQQQPQQQQQAVQQWPQQQQQAGMQQQPQQQQQWPQQQQAQQMQQQWPAQQQAQMQQWAQQPQMQQQQPQQAQQWPQPQQQVQQQQQWSQQQQQQWAQQQQQPQNTGYGPAQNQSNRPDHHQAPGMQ